MYDTTLATITYCLSRVSGFDLMTWISAAQSTSSTGDSEHGGITFSHVTHIIFYFGDSVIVIMSFPTTAFANVLSLHTNVPM